MQRAIVQPVRAARPGAAALHRQHAAWRLGAQLSRRRPGGGVAARAGSDGKSPSTTSSDTSDRAAPELPALASLGAPLPTSPAQERSDLYRALGVGTALTVALALIEQDWVRDHESMALTAVFLLGYGGIIVEEALGFNKSGVALLMAAAIWSVRAATEGAGGELEVQAGEALADVSQVLFFLTGAMAIVETVDAHQGFRLITDAIATRNRRQLLWLIATLTFFLSALLDNLTTTIVMVSLLQKLCPHDQETRRYLGAVVVVAANAGGVWTPIGDVTTTMLWIGSEITTVPTIRDLLLPSLVSLAVPLALMTALADEVKGDVARVESNGAASTSGNGSSGSSRSSGGGGGGGGGGGLAPRGQLVTAVGLAALLAVPLFRSLTGLPPYLGMLGGLGVLWVLTDALHYGEKDRADLTVPRALQRVDSGGVLFFLGILMAVAALDGAGLLTQVAAALDETLPSDELVAAVIGLASAVVDNVPLVAAAMGMYDLAAYPPDSRLWQLIAYCAGTGGSLLIIGSAAGVAFMGLEKGASFGWYLKKVTPWAALGYAAGIGAYVAQQGAVAAATAAGAGGVAAATALLQ